MVWWAAVATMYDACDRVRKQALAKIARSDAVKKRREVDAAGRTIKAPPVLAPSERKTLARTGATWSMREVATLLGRTNVTIANWFRTNRLQAWVDGTGPTAPRRVPVAEVRRVAKVLGVKVPRVAPEVGPSAAHVAQTEAGLAAPHAGSGSSIEWTVPPDERITDEPVTFWRDRIAVLSRPAREAVRETIFNAVASIEDDSVKRSENPVRRQFRHPGVAAHCRRRRARVPVGP